MTERGGTIIFCIIFSASPMSPHTPPTPQYLFILMTERRRHYICRILAPPPPPQTPQYLTILMTERGHHYVCRSLAPPMPPPSHDATILNYLNDRERGRHYFLSHFGAPQCPPPSPDDTILNNLNDREGAPLCL